MTTVRATSTCSNVSTCWRPDEDPNGVATIETEARRVPPNERMIMKITIVVTIMRP